MTRMRPVPSSTLPASHPTGPHGRAGHADQAASAAKAPASDPAPRPTVTRAQTPAEGALLTLDDVAALDRTSVRTARRAVAAGLLEVLRVGPKGRLIRVTPEAYAAYRQRLAQRW